MRLMWKITDLESLTLDELGELAVHHGIVRAVEPSNDGVVLHLTSFQRSLALAREDAYWYLVGCLSAIPLIERDFWPAEGR